MFPLWIFSKGKACSLRGFFFILFVVCWVQTIIHFVEYAAVGFGRIQNSDFTVVPLYLGGFPLRLDLYGGC